MRPWGVRIMVLLLFSVTGWGNTALVARRSVACQVLSSCNRWKRSVTTCVMHTLCLLTTRFELRLQWHARGETKWHLGCQHSLLPGIRKSRYATYGSHLGAWRPCAVFASRVILHQRKGSGAVKEPFLSYVDWGHVFLKALWFVCCFPILVSDSPELALCARQRWGVQSGAWRCEGALQRHACLCHMCGEPSTIGRSWKVILTNSQRTEQVLTQMSNLLSPILSYTKNGWSKCRVFHHGNSGCMLILVCMLDWCRIVATNVFELQRGEWLICLHQGGPVIPTSSNAGLWSIFLGTLKNDHSNQLVDTRRKMDTLWVC